MPDRTCNSSKIAAAIALAIATSGCVVGPEFETPESNVQPEWIDASAPEIDSTKSPDAEWWKVFDDPELTGLIETAFAENLTLRAAALRIFRARAVLGIARGARYPQTQVITGTASANRFSPNAPPLSVLPDNVRDNIDPTTNVYQLGFDAIWELDFWGRFRRGIDAAEANFSATIADFDDVLVILTAEVAATYISVRTLEERLVVARENVSNQERGLELAQIRFNGGLTTALDVHQASALLNTTRASVAALMTELRRTQNALATLLGTTPGEIQSMLSSPGSIPQSPTDVAVGIPADLLRRRPDIARAELLAAAQSARIGIAEADLYPAFFLGGSFGLESVSTSNLFESDSRAGTGFAGFSWPIFNYGRLRNNVRAEDARFEEALVNYQNTVLLAAREVEDALIGFTMAQQETEHLNRAVDDATRALKLAEVMYEEGAADYTRVLTAQQSLLLAQDDYTSSRGNVAVNLVAAYKALGGGWEMRIGRDILPEATRETMEERTNWGSQLEPGEIPAGETR